MSKNGKVAASFRDPSGFLFFRDGDLYRQVNRVYAGNYTHLMESGLYERLLKAGLLIPHCEVNVKPAEPTQAYKVIQPERVPFVSYPYEWSFSQLKDAALATLSIHKRALKMGMSLKDASAYNIQFIHGKPVLIDTLSFELYPEGAPWVAYRQFCQHFLAPLALMAARDIRLNQLMRVYIDGIPLDLCSRLLPRTTLLNIGLLSHIHIHAQAQKRYAHKAIERPGSGAGMSMQAMLGLVESLMSVLRKLEWQPKDTEWGNYYDISSYSDAAFEDKKQLVSDWVGRIRPKTVWDLGANTGVFSRLASQRGAYTVAFDMDPAAVEKNYRRLRIENERNLLPLVFDLTNPSPAIGWQNRERLSLCERAPADAVFALALIHHLVIANNVPLPQVAEYFHSLGKWLVIEFIPKSDTQAKKLLMSREDIFPGYTRQGFEQVFDQKFNILEAVGIRESERVLYLMKSR